MRSLGGSQAVPQLTSYHVDVLLIEHGFVTIVYSMNLQTAVQQAVPAGIKIPVSIGRPITGLKENSPPG